MWLPLPLSFTLLISLSVAVLGNLSDVNPPARSLRHSQTLERRTGLGSYAILSPEGDKLVWDPSARQYSILLKFGDGPEKRLTAYNTHNPSFEFSHRPELKSAMSVAGQQRDPSGRTAKAVKVFSGPPKKKKISRAKRMEEVLSDASKTDPLKVIHLKNKNDNSIEWYEIVVATNQETATKAKKEFRALVAEYETLPLTLDDEVAYARKLIALIEKYTEININVGMLQYWQGAKKAFDKQKALVASQAAAQPASGATSSTTHGQQAAGQAVRPGGPTRTSPRLTKQNGV
ncbi:hypothetical protein H0H92_008218 [Tricholoma furcatifolium]|nr:hypothetical protein H0H92_008218 [Tricholoma furcatifolium]